MLIYPESMIYKQYMCPGYLLLLPYHFRITKKEAALFRQPRIAHYYVYVNNL